MDEHQENQPIKRKAGRPPGAPNKAGLIIKEKNKKLLLKALEENLGVLAPALKVSAISRETFNNYYEQDLNFRIKVDEIREMAIDAVESELIKQIKSGGAAQTIFYLKTKGKSRGYIETSETNMTIDAVKIKYIVPNEEDNKLPSGERPALPLDNKLITIQLPENGDNKAI